MNISRKMAEGNNDLPRFPKALNELIDCLLSEVSINCAPVRMKIDLEEYLGNLEGCDAIDSNVQCYTGSRAEGIYTGSDIDVMLVDKTKRVINGPVATQDMNDGTVYLTPRNVRPGFVHLLSDSIEGGFLRHDGPEKKLFLAMSEGSLVEHGPAIATSDGDMDCVFAVANQEWPDTAREFTTRERKHNQPCREMVERITGLGCLYVQVGHRKSQDPGKEWRISFSTAEKILIRSWNNTHLNTYIAIKTLIKKNLSKEPIVIPSYFIKTAILWLIERFPDSFWTSEEILTCISAVLWELLFFTITGRCPNYFIPSNNMMDHFTADQLPRLPVKSKAFLTTWHTPSSRLNEEAIFLFTTF